MHIVAGLTIAGFVLWLWLSAHWFGRVLAFLFGSALALMMAAATGLPNVAVGSLLIGLPIAWAIASAPVWVARGYVIRAG